MARPITDVYMMGLAMMAASRASCSRRAVGCILTNTLNHVVATGYNGPPRGMAHCSDVMCPGMSAPSGQQLDGCMAIHAEQNALLQCHDTRDILRCYVTAQPCLTCMKLLLNTSCKEIIFLEPYPHPIAHSMWIGAGRTMSMIPAEQVQELAELFRVMSERSGSALTLPRSS